MSLDVVISSPQGVVFKGNANSIILPGERGVFEVLSFHRPLLSRLIQGKIVIDQTRVFPIYRGIAKVLQNNIIILIEEV